MALDYANERFVLLYTRDTVTWKLLDWEARAVLMFLLRKVDRAGVIDVGEDGLEGLAALIEVPIDVVRRTAPQLLRRDTVASRSGYVVLPNFLAAQETPRSDRQRQRDSRETRRDVALAAERGLVLPAVHLALPAVTERDNDDMERDNTVTVGHAESQSVTPTLPDPTITNQTESDPAPPASPSLPGLGLQPDPPAKLDPVADLWAFQERLRAESVPGCRPLKLTDDRRRLVRDARKLGYSDDDLRAALVQCATETKLDPKNARWFNGETNWRPKSIAFRLGSIGSPPPRPTGGGSASTALTLEDTR